MTISDKPTVGGDAGSWGTKLNIHLDSLKAYVDSEILTNIDTLTLVNTTNVRVFRKYLTGTTAANASTSVAHGITSALTKILGVSGAIQNASQSKFYVCEMNRSSSGGNTYFYLTFDATNVNFEAVGSDLQGAPYVICVDYIL